MSFFCHPLALLIVGKYQSKFYYNFFKNCDHLSKFVSIIHFWAFYLAYHNRIDGCFGHAITYL